MQASQSQSPVWHGTTILTVRKGGKVVIGGDGQVSIGQTVIKSNAKKVRKLGKGDVIGGFAGATADAFTLFERLESKLEQYPGQLTRAAVELAKDWRTDRYLRRLEAMMIVADKDVSLVLTGTGDVLEPEAGVMAIGSGGNYALAAARALVDSDKDAETIVRRALDIAADICVYTNRNVTIETLESAADRWRRTYVFRPMTAADLPLVRRWLGTAACRANGGAIPTNSIELVSGDLDRARHGPVYRLDGRQPVRLSAVLRPDRTGIPALGRSPGHARHRSVHRRARHDRARPRLGFHPRLRRRRCWRTARRASSPIPIPPMRRAIRAYEKAGFARDRLVDTPDGPALLMVRNP